jgi:uncharacterized protein (DUF1778 family)
MPHKHKAESTDAIAIRVRPTADQKELFQRAAAATPAGLSLNQWMILAALEKAERDGAGKLGAAAPARR